MLYFSIAGALGLNIGASTAPSTSRAAVSMDLGRPIRVAVIGGGPSGACAAEIFAQVCLPPEQPLTPLPRRACARSVAAARGRAAA